ncbi:MAG: response regulator [Acidobacteriota bacterium]|nr:response regulator [Acidobacteriota bacterium]
MPEPLTTLMAAGDLTTEDVVRIGCAAAEALVDVHGELWPSAIVVDEDRVGIAPPGISDRSRYGQYSAPERTLGQPATPASDVFSLGAILFHALAGYAAFRGDTPAAVMLAACTEAPRELPADVPKDLAEVILRCLSRNPADRYVSPAALKIALENVGKRDNYPGQRILIADDDAPIREFYMLAATRLGVQADVVATGRDAIAAMKSRKYDVALMDLNMPRLSGWEVLDFLRSNLGARPKRLFIVTGFADQQLSAPDRSLVDAVLYKPVASDELRTLVTECLRGGHVDVKGILRTTGHRLSAA